MPYRLADDAPSFGPRYPQELPHYFDHVEQLLRRSEITDLTKQKWLATYYAGLVGHDLWRAIPEYENPSCDFAEFKTALFRLYPEVKQVVAEARRLHFPSNESEIETLIAECERGRALSPSSVSHPTVSPRPNLDVHHRPYPSRPSAHESVQETTGNRAASTACRPSRRSTLLTPPPARLAVDCHAN
jgi:hypothetical protein